LTSGDSILEEFESQGERRRAQILAITAKLVIAGGAESVTHSAVAERAGLVRTAVYRYFPTRDDLLAALLTEYSALHTQRIDPKDAAAGVRALARATPKRVPPETRLLLEKLWAPEDWSRAVFELRLAIIILQRDAELLARLEAGHQELSTQRTVEQTGPLAQLGLDPIEIRIVNDTTLAVLYHAVSASLAGTIDRDEAIRLTYRTLLAVVQAFLD
jgi:AcrR family transcriptional regulator